MSCGPLSLIQRSEYKLQSELNQPGIVDRIVDASKGAIRKEGVRRAKLRMVEEIEKLSPEFQAHPFGRTEGRSLENSQVEIHDTLQAKAGIHARLVSKDNAYGLPVSCLAASVRYELP